MSFPLVAIVGRPNVGKSTLFNRILGGRDAIVHETPGVTRDRNYGDAEWAGKRFTLIDTGGFVPRSEDIFEKAIREQSGIAISESDAVIFLLDAGEGLTLLDEEIAQELRKSQKPVHVVVNKIDSAALEDRRLEFYKLGLGEPHGLGALGGRGIGDFLDVLTASFRKNGKRAKSEAGIRVAVVGRPNVGKSSLVNALIGKARHLVTPVPGTTRDSIDSAVMYEENLLLLVDTAGLRKPSRIEENVEFYSTLRTIRSIDRCDVVAVVLDAQQGLEKQDMRIVETAMERHRPTLLVVNKWDLVEKDSHTSTAYEKAILHKLGIYDFLPVVFISAKTHQRVNKVLQTTVALHLEGKKRIATSRLNKTIMAEIDRNPPKSSGSREIRIKYAAQVKSSPPTFSFFCNEPSLVQESYRRYLDNQLREHFGFSGVPLTIVFRKK
ncbi:MAG TPA: ribosome biogenesis GTPase Der [Bacteroidota bacterium]|nr:ribosome biogenesis GTPase Der [Bacteroidota bacterium]